VTPLVHFVAFLEPASGQPCLANDEVGRLLGWGRVERARIFAARLEDRGVANATVLVRFPDEIATVLLASGKTEGDFYLVEAQTLDETDALRWTLELADRVPLVEAGPEVT
jgi:hypothetical protein